MRRRSLCCLFAAYMTTAAGSIHTSGFQQRMSSKFRFLSSSTSSPQDFKERVFVCNAFVDDQPIMVSCEKGSHGSELAYKQCEHYDVDIQGGTPLLLQPAELDEAIDALSFEGAPTSEGCGGINNTCVAVIHRQGKRSQTSAVQWLKISNGENQPEIAAVDAYATVGDDVARGLAAAGIPGISAAVFRIEDKINPQLELSRQVVASRTLGLGRVYSASPGAYHLVLEDLKGSSMVGYQDINLAKGGQYIVMRVGEPGSNKYPEELVFSALVEPNADGHHKSSAQHGAFLTLGTALTLFVITACSS